MTVRSLPVNRRTKIALDLLRHQYGLCFWCQNPIEDIDFDLTLDHLVALAHGGTNNVHNLVASCNSCNQVFSDAGLKYKILWLVHHAKNISTSYSQEIH